MAQDGSKDSAATLEEWCSLYLNAADTSSELGPLLKTLVTPEPVHLEAAEVRVAEAMKEMTVAGGFCSTCQSILDNWPDLTQYNIRARLAEEAEGRKSGTYPMSHSSGSDSRFWIHPQHGTTVDFPYHEDIVRRMASARNGCKLCALIISCLRHNGALNLYIEIDRRLHKFGKSSQIYMATSSWPPFTYEYTYFLSTSHELPTKVFLPRPIPNVAFH